MFFLAAQQRCLLQVHASLFCLGHCWVHFGVQVTQ